MSLKSTDITAQELRRPFRATGAELEFYQLVINRWRTLPAEAVLTEAARLFHFAVAIVGPHEH